MALLYHIKESLIYGLYLQCINDMINLYLTRITKINRVNDVFFKYAFGSTERKNWTLNFLNIILALEGKQQFTDITFADKDLLPQEQDEKLSILDTLATTNDGTKEKYEEYKGEYHQSYHIV